MVLHQQYYSNNGESCLQGTTVQNEMSYWYNAITQKSQKGEMSKLRNPLNLMNIY